jgi:polyhydroxybutyrate depolymerase
MRIPPTASLALLLALVACAPPLTSLPLDAPGAYSAAIDHRGVRRTFELYLPRRRNGALPLLVALHGGGSSGADMAEVTGFNRIAEREGFVAVYPDGIGGPHGFGRAWNAGPCCGIPHWLGIDDGDFVMQLEDDLRQRLRIDEHRIYLVGYSNGGLLAHDVALRFGDRLAAVAVYGATMPAYGPVVGPRFDGGVPEAPLSTLVMHSYDDPIVAYQGTEHRDYTDISVAHARQFWATAAGCNQAPERRYERDGALRIDVSRGCPEGIAIEAVTLHGWTHEWPAREAIDGCKPPGDPLRSFDAAERIWRFFADKRRP